VVKQIYRNAQRLFIVTTTTTTATTTTTTATATIQTKNKTLIKNTAII